MIKLNIKEKESLFLNIKISYNNVIVSLTNKVGHILLTKTGGSIGFKGAKKNSNLCFINISKIFSSILFDNKIKNIKINFKGINMGREYFINSLKEQRIIIDSIFDKTSLPFNGCRPSKKRRI